MTSKLAMTALFAMCALTACSSTSSDRHASTSHPIAATSTPATMASDPVEESTTTSSSVIRVKGGWELCLELAVFGDPQDSQYLLPFPVGQGYTILQSYCNDDGSHERQLAYDFLMPIGSAVHAARGGTVWEVKEDAFDNTGTRFFNYVIVEHSDGTLGFYAHLTHDGALVEVGEEVAAGDRIALSGASGRTHEFGVLHFGVFRPVAGGEPVEIPVVFRNSEGPLDSRGGLREGSFYKALPDPNNP